MARSGPRTSYQRNLGTTTFRINLTRSIAIEIMWQKMEKSSQVKTTLWLTNSPKFRLQTRMIWAVFIREWKTILRSSAESSQERCLQYRSSLSHLFNWGGVEALGPIPEAVLAGGCSSMEHQTLARQATRIWILMGNMIMGLLLVGVEVSQITISAWGLRKPILAWNRLLNTSRPTPPRPETEEILLPSTRRSQHEDSRVGAT